MSYLQFIETMSAEIYQRLLRAVELGKWPDGRVLTSEQREHAMQAIIAWGKRHLAERDRVGYIPKKTADALCDTPLEAPLKWQQ